MKTNAILTASFLLVIMAGLSCKKNKIDPPAHTPGERKVTYILYTSKNFAANNQSITFTLRMTTASGVLWDSVLAPMALKNIPGASNKLIIEKKVPGNNNSELVTGFTYVLENVGISWYNEIFKAGDVNKTVSFDFQ